MHRTKTMRQYGAYLVFQGPFPFYTLTKETSVNLHPHTFLWTYHLWINNGGMVCVRIWNGFGMESLLFCCVSFNIKYQYVHLPWRFHISLHLRLLTPSSEMRQNFISTFLMHHITLTWKVTWNRGLLRHAAPSCPRWPWRHLHPHVLCH